MCKNILKSLHLVLLDLMPHNLIYNSNLWSYFYVNLSHKTSVKLLNLRNIMCMCVVLEGNSQTVLKGFILWGAWICTKIHSFIFWYLSCTRDLNGMARFNTNKHLIQTYYLLTNYLFWGVKIKNINRTCKLGRKLWSDWITLWCLKWGHLIVALFTRGNWSQRWRRPENTVWTPCCGLLP